MSSQNIIWLNEADALNVNKVGGKNASLSEMIQHLSAENIRVPMGFATTADAYRQFLAQNELDQRIYKVLKKLDVKDVKALAKVGAEIRQWIIDAPFLPDFEADLSNAFQQLNKDTAMTVAVRSSATAEDLPSASFAGQQETYLNIRGLDNLFKAVKKVFASLYTDRAIAYRIHHGFEHSKVALSACVQYMVRSDLSTSGVAFTLDTETGFREVVLINAAYGLGETVVQGTVDPDEYYLYKPNLKANRPAILRKNLGAKAIKTIYADEESAQEDFVKTVDVPKSEQLKFALNDKELHELSNYALSIEMHYKRPMDIEWAKDGLDGQLYIVQARPETVESQVVKQTQIKRYRLSKRGKVIVEGHSIGQRIGQGKARILKDASEIEKLRSGDVLVTEMTDPDWEPIMKKASAIVTDRGGRTCHAAIVARELGIPAIVGCSHATTLIKDEQAITISCAEGEVGYVYDGLLDFKIEKIDVKQMPELPLDIMMNIGNPDQAFSVQSLPNHGVGLARIEFIISQMIGIHPNAILHFDEQPADIKDKIQEKISCYNNPLEFYIEKLREGISTIAAAFYPKPVIVRTSDFKSNEYANLLGGKQYELLEENPMLGFRGASRYVHERFRECFKLECQALCKVREEMGLTNVEVMIPFVRTVEEAEQVVQLLADNGLKRGENGLKVIMMCEVPSNAILPEDFLKHFDGFSIGSNDLTQLTLGLDRDSEVIAKLFDERNEAVKYFLSQAIQACNKLNKYIGICGQAPSDYPDLAKWLMEQDIGSISLNPDTIVETWLHLKS